MTKWIATHKSVGGLFLVTNSPPGVLQALDKNLAEGYDWDADGFQSWLNPGWWGGYDMGDFFSPVEGIDSHVFEFKGKSYINMGVGELGFKKIRCVDNIDHYVRPIEDVKAVSK